MEKILWALLMFWNVENCFAPFEIGKRGDFGEKNGIDVVREKSESGESGMIEKLSEFGVTEKNSVTNAIGGRDVGSGNERYRKWSIFNRKRDAIAGTIALVAQNAALETMEKMERRSDEKKHRTGTQVGRYPDIIGLAEVENRWVVKQIAENSILAAQEYGIVHHDSPDTRGIDVALLYRRSTFRILSRRFIPITTPKGNRVTSFNTANDSLTHMNICEDTLRTREMLYVKGVLREMDTLHIMVVHWPSKLGGEAAERNRTLAATCLRNLCDSIYRPGWHSPKIIVMGDFNAGGGDPALEYLVNGAALKFPTAGGKENKLYDKNGETSGGERMALLNDVVYSTEYDVLGCGIYDGMADETYNGQVRGTYKYKGVWESIDRFYVSGYFLENKEIWTDGAQIFSHPSLLEEDKVYLGVKPRRCFVGPRYNGGISDHLPVVLRLWGTLEQ